MPCASAWRARFTVQILVASKESIRRRFDRTERELRACVRTAACPWRCPPKGMARAIGDRSGLWRVAPRVLARQVVRGDLGAVGLAARHVTLQLIESPWATPLANLRVAPSIVHYREEAGDRKAVGAPILGSYHVAITRWQPAHKGVCRGQAAIGDGSSG